MTPAVVALKVIASPRKSTAWDGLLPLRMNDAGVGVAAISSVSSSVKNKTNDQ